MNKNGRGAKPHDLSVALEVASSSACRKTGRGLEIRWGRAGTPFGLSTIGWTARGVCHLSFGRTAAGLRREWPEAILARRDAECGRLARKIFHPAPRARSRIRVFVRGTPFQAGVWRALLAIPPGRLASYDQVAVAVKRPKAVRAAAGACGANAVAWLIPCHRIVRKTGAIHGYRWGAERKRAMIAREASPDKGARLRTFGPTAGPPALSMRQGRMGIGGNRRKMAQSEP